jgi:hypothetical protein
MLDVTNAYLAKISELPESLEIHFHLPHQEFINDTGTAVLNLVINHSLCIASHNADDVKGGQCMSLGSYAVFGFHLLT